MAKVEWSAGIDSVSGALSKPSKSGQHSCSKMLLGTHRVAATTSCDCNRLFLRKKSKRSTPVTSDERAWRNRFKAIVLPAGGFRDRLREQFLIHKMRAGAGCKETAVLYKAHAADVDLAVSFDGIFDGIT